MLPGSRFFGNQRSQDGLYLRARILFPSPTSCGEAVVSSANAEGLSVADCSLELRGVLVANSGERDCSSDGFYGASSSSTEVWGSLVARPPSLGNTLLRTIIMNRGYPSPSPDVMGVFYVPGIG